MQDQMKFSMTLSKKHRNKPKKTHHSHQYVTIAVSWKMGAPLLPGLWPQPLASRPSQASPKFLPHRPPAPSLQMMFLSQDRRGGSRHAITLPSVVWRYLKESLEGREAFPLSLPTALPPPPWVLSVAAEISNNTEGLHLLRDSGPFSSA